MKKIKIIFVLICLSFAGKAQVFQAMPQYGYGPIKRMWVDSTLLIPTICGTPSIKTYETKHSAITYDSCNKRLYFYDPKLMAWDTIKSGSFDSTSLSSRIDARVKYTDTSGMLSNYVRTSALAGKVDSVKKSADSVYYWKAGQKYFGFRDNANGSGGGQNGRFGNDTATVVMAKVHNDAGVQLTNGKVVYLCSSGSSSDVPSVKLANNKGDSSSANTFGFVSGAIANNDTGWVILSGKIEKLNTSGFSNGDIIYLDSVSGQWTKSKPQAPYHMVYLGVIIKANAGNGAIFVKPQNGYETSELHDVQTNGKVNNQILVYSDTQKVWKNKSAYSVIDTTKLSIRIDQRVKYTDTAFMLTNYAKTANVVKYTDTAAMLTNYAKTITVNTKLNISDTSNMLSAYHRKADSVIYQTKYRTDTMRTNVYSALNNKQGTLTLTTTGSSGAATLTGNILNIPQYSGGGSYPSAGAQGDIQYKSGSGFGASPNLHWDTANYRLGVGTSIPQNTLDVGLTVSNMNRGYYEAASFTTDGDTKVGIYSNGDNGQGASLTFGNVQMADEDGYYLGMEMQYIPNYDAFSENSYKINSLKREANGQVAAAVANLLEVKADGEVRIAPTGYLVNVNPSLYVAGVTTTTGQRFGIRFTSESNNIEYTDHVILASSPDNDITLTLPYAVAGQVYTIKKINEDFYINIEPQSGEYIENGQTKIQLTTALQYVQLIADDGGSWWIIGNN